MENLVKKFADDLLRHRKYHYSQESLQEFLMVNSDLDCLNFKVINQKGYMLDSLLLKQPYNSTCIIYAHGLGSNKLQSLYIAKYFMRQRYDVCSFDFSASGRSQGQYTTYGINQRDDLISVIKHIQSLNRYDRIVLWGRSMGAVAVVLSLQSSLPQKLDSIVLDSAFISFQKIAIEIGSKKSFIPKFMIELILQPLKEYIKTNYEINPFNINLENILKKININILVIYSEQDTIVSSQHSKHICHCCRINPHQVVIKEDHNMQRSKSTMHRVLNFLREANKELERRIFLSKQKNRGISVTSKEKKDRESVRSNSKIKLLQPSNSKLSARQPSSKHPQRHIRTVASINIDQSINFSKRLDTQSSPVKKRIGTINSLFIENKLLQKRLSNHPNKENKPSLNLLRKNRFR